MTNFDRLRLVDDHGCVLDGSFDLEERTDGGFDVVLHAKGGSKPGARTNHDYFDVLELILKRAATASMVLTDLLIDSKPARQLPVDERRLPIELPIDLGRVGDIAELRVRITEAQPDIATRRNSGARGGNKHRRLRLRLSSDHSLSELHKLFVGVDSDESPIASPQFGSAYFDDPVDASLSPSSMIHRDDSKLERSLRGHAETQRQLAAQVRDAGLKPQKRGPHDPDFDVAWRLGSRIIVAEVKSLPTGSPSHQLRQALGQVLEYRYRLARLYDCPVEAVIATEFDPGGPWSDICRHAGVTLTWPPAWNQLAPCLDLLDETDG